MSNSKRYRLHLTYEQLEMMKDIFESYDWLCDCKEFPNCDDFKMFKKLKSRINVLENKSELYEEQGRESFRKLKSKMIQEGADLKRKIDSKKL